MIEADAIFAEFPAEIDVLIIDARREVQQANGKVFYDATGGLDFFEGRFDGVVQAIALDPQLCRALIGDLEAARPLDAFGKGAELFVIAGELTLTLHGLDQNRLQLNAQAFGFGKREKFAVVVSHAQAPSGHFEQRTPVDERNASGRCKRRMHFETKIQPPMKTMERAGGTKSGSLMRCPFSFSAMMARI